MGKPSGLKQTERLSTNTFCSRSVQGAVSWCFCRLFFFFLNHISTSCITMRNLHLSTCLKTEQVCLCVFLWSAMKPAVVFREDVPENTELLVPPVFFREFHPHPLLWLCVFVCVCVHWQALICMSFSEWCAYISIHICKGRPTRDLNILNFKLW